MFGESHRFRLFARNSYLAGENTSRNCLFAPCHTAPPRNSVIESIVLAFGFIFLAEAERAARQTVMSIVNHLLAFDIFARGAGRECVSLAFMIYEDFIAPNEC
jgi:hypothetical protein